MKILYLLRHAKSSWDDPRLDDRDRPLAPRGCAAATAIGHHLARFDAWPDRVLCSPARRSVDTLAGVLAVQVGGAAPAVEIREELYLQGGDALLAAVRSLPAEANRALLVGHDPDIHALATLLAGDGEPGPLAALRRKYPTGALAVLTLPAWSEAGPGAARLREFVQPRELVE